MAITCGECVQCAFLCLSAVAAAGGIILAGVGITALARDDWQLVQLLDPSLYPAVGAVLTAVGGLVAVLASLAFCGGRLENSRLLRVFFWVTLALLVASGVAAVVGFAMGAPSALEDVREGMQKSLHRYNFDEQVRQQWDSLQGEFQCCGVDGAADWAPVMGHDQVPFSCCQPDWPGGCTVFGAYNVGCVRKMSDVVETYSAVIGSVSVAMALVLLVAMVASFALIKNSEGAEYRYMMLRCPAGSM